VEEPTQETSWVLLDQKALPVGQLDAPLVLATRPVLREQAWPVLPAHACVDRTGVGDVDGLPDGFTSRIVSIISALSP
jgi:hypothetical protein